MGRSQRNKNKNKKENNPVYAMKQQERLSVKAERNAIKQQKRRESKRAKNKIMEKRYLIGLYDNTRRKGGNHTLLPSAQCEYIGNYDTEPIYYMYSFEDNTWCGIKTGGNTSINIEVYSVSEEISDNLDDFNSYDPSSRDMDNLFLREKVNSPYGEIEIYIYNNETFNNEPLESGDWIDYINTLIVKKPIPNKAERKASLEKMLNEAEIELSINSITVSEKDEIEEHYKPGKVVNFMDYVKKDEEIKVTVPTRPVPEVLQEARDKIKKAREDRSGDIMTKSGLHTKKAEDAWNNTTSGSIIIEDDQERVDKEFMD